MICAVFAVHLAIIQVCIQEAGGYILRAEDKWTRLR